MAPGGSWRSWRLAGWWPGRAGRLASRGAARGLDNGGPPRRPAPLGPALAAVAILGLHLLLFPPLPRLVANWPRQGEVAPRDIRAPFAFSAPLLERDVELLRLERVLTEPPVLRRVEGAEDEPLARFAAWRQELLDQHERRGVPAAERARLLDVRFPGLDEEALRQALTVRRPERLLDAMERALRELLAGGVADLLPPGKYELVRLVTAGAETTSEASHITPRALLAERLPYILRAQGLEPEPAGWAAGLVAPFAQPNWIYDPVATRARQDEARQAVPTRREFIKGERLVDQGVRVSAQEALYLEELARHLAERGGLESRGAAPWRLALRLLLVAAALVLFGWTAWSHFPELLARPRFLAAGVASLALFLLAAALCLGRPALGVFAVPVPLLAVLVTVLFRDRVGYGVTLLGVGLLTPLPDVGGGAVFAWTMLGVAAVAAVRRLQQRSQFYRAIALLCALAALLVTVLRAGGLAGPAPLGHAYLVAVAMPVAAVALALFLLPVVEPLVGVSSDLTLLELSDLNHPLLKQMALESQGTYHHSQVVSQLAEQAARAIGANSLLTRVGALFHDIGKLNKPEYFVENQRDGVNRHDELSPSMSALVVASHVKDGIELGRRWRLPEAVLDFIPEHHGTSVMEFFYHKALEDESYETVKVDDFRYPGPRPRSRETAILMIVDAVEAAARSLAKPTPGRIREVVKQVVDKRLLSGELDDSHLTMSDLAGIREAIIPLLTGIHHARISYPGQRDGRDREGPREASRDREPSRDREREAARGRDRAPKRSGEPGGDE